MEKNNSFFMMILLASSTCIAMESEPSDQPNNELESFLNSSESLELDPLIQILKKSPKEARRYSDPNLLPKRPVSPRKEGYQAPDQTALRRSLSSLLKASRELLDEKLRNSN